MSGTEAKEKDVSCKQVKADSICSVLNARFNRETINQGSLIARLERLLRRVFHSNDEYVEKPCAEEPLSHIDYYRYLLERYEDNNSHLEAIIEELERFF